MTQFTISVSYILLFILKVKVLYAQVIITGVTNHSYIVKMVLQKSTFLETFGLPLTDAPR
jgi:hypothetical protein